MPRYLYFCGAPLRGWVYMCTCRSLVRWRLVPGGRSA